MANGNQVEYEDRLINMVTLEFDHYVASVIGPCSVTLCSRLSYLPSVNILS